MPHSFQMTSRAYKQRPSGFTSPSNIVSPTYRKLRRWSNHAAFLPCQVPFRRSADCSIRYRCIAASRQQRMDGRPSSNSRSRRVHPVRAEHGWHSVHPEAAFPNSPGAWSSGSVAPAAINSRWDGAQAVGSSQARLWEATRLHLRRFTHTSWNRKVLSYTTALPQAPQLTQSIGSQTMLTTPSESDSPGCLRRGKRSAATDDSGRRGQSTCEERWEVGNCRSVR